MSIIGEPFAPYVNKQIEVRQKLMGKTSNRGEEMLSWANSKTAWVKLASGVSLDGEGEEAKKRIEAIGNLNWDEVKGEGLAKNFILFGGVAKRIENKNDSSITPWPKYTLMQKSKFNKIYDITDTDFGQVPMPGIESVNVNDKNRGSIKEATIELKVYSRKQLEIIDILYLRLGYTVLLEWGNSHYIDNNGEYKTMGPTIVEEFNDFFENVKPDYREIYSKIENLRGRYSGNYDGFVAKVVNFNWSFEPDGSYRITLKLISLGDIVDSFKINTSADNPYDLKKSEYSSNKIIENLNISKIINQSNSPNQLGNISVQYLSPPNITKRSVGWFIDSELNIVFEDKKRSPLGLGVIVGREKTHDYDDLEKTLKFLGLLYLDKHPQIWKKLYPNQLEFEIGIKQGFWSPKYIPVSTNILDYYDDLDNLRDELKIKRKSIAETTTDEQYYFKIKIKPGTLDLSNNQISNNSTIYLNHLNPEDNDLESNLNYYTTFSNLLGMVDEVLSSFPNSPTIIGGVIEGKRMINQMSFDPRICVVQNSIFYDPNSPNKVLNNYPELEIFQKVKGGERFGDFGNCYINFTTIIDSLNSNQDENGDVNVISFLEDICDKINKAMGGINNLQPQVDEIKNEIRIIDTSYPSQFINTPQTKFQIYGYNGESGINSESTFVRNVNLKTEISPKFASMITIGSTASGYAKGMEATAFSKWNKGLIDRFKNLEKVEEESQPTIEKNYLEYLLNLQDPLNYLGFDKNKNDWHFLNLEIIETNLSVATEFFKYLRAKTYEKDPENYSSTANGFIPFNLSFTMDGISGIKIYNKIEVDTRFLPYNYPESLKFIVKKVSHKLSGNDWETTIDTTVMPGAYSV